MTTRSQLPARICQLLQAPANVAVHGTPGSGKSWIADQVLAELGTLNVDTVRIDLSTVSSGAEAFRLIAGTAVADRQMRSTRDEWRDTRTKFEARETHIVIVLDQFDRVLQFEDAHDFLLLLREMVHRPESLHCTALMFSRRPLASIELKVRGISLLASVCYTQFLGAMSPVDVAGLAPANASLDDDEVDECLRWSGGHPFLSKYWLTTRPDRSADPAADLERARVVLRVLKNLEDQGLLVAAAQLVLGPVISDMLIEKQELELLGVLPEWLPAAGAPSASTSLSELVIFHDALRHLTWDMDPWGVMGLAEVRLRGVIDTLLSERIGDTWPEEVARRSPAVKKAREEADLKISRDQRSFGRAAPWLSYTYPGDLWAIVQSEWEILRDVFDTADKPHWHRVLMGLAQYRAPLAHGRPEVLSDAQRAQICVYADEVIARIQSYETRQIVGPGA